MLFSRFLLGCLLLGSAFTHAETSAPESCLTCHLKITEDLPAHHRFPGAPCTPCHSGNPTAPTESESHQGLVARPGELDNSRRSCGGCHAIQTDWVAQSPMSLGTNMVGTTRAVFGDSSNMQGSNQIRNFGHAGADSLLRKLCVSCHLGQPQSGHEGDPIHARGGGCLACHLARGEERTHRQLYAKVDDRHCFGCHSRSGRISLNYAGLGEVELSEIKSDRLEIFRLGDGRHVELKTADVHHRAGMGCTDCHTGPGVMGAFVDAGSGSGIDIACDDCHADAPMHSGPDQQAGIYTTRHGTPLSHIKVSDDGVAKLHRKSDGRPLEIPRLSDGHDELLKDHKTLTCDACHATWAPQCFGCHIEYDPNESQWDHLEGRETPGSWEETRWDLRNQAAPIGHRTDGRIGLFVPGMILTLNEAGEEDSRFIRRFAPLHPHTIGASRECVDCHRKPQSLGLGSGSLSLTNGNLEFSASMPTLDDGLPADGWATLNEGENDSTEGHRPLSAEDILRLYNTKLPGD